MAFTSRKRPLSECLEDLSCVTESSDANLQGVVTVDQMKIGKSGTSYFDGNITDEKRTLRMFGYDASVRDKILETIKESDGGGIVLKHCEVKRRKLERGDGLEVHYHIAVLRS